MTRFEQTSLNGECDRRAALAMTLCPPRPCEAPKGPRQSLVGGRSPRCARDDAVLEMTGRVAQVKPTRRTLTLLPLMRPWFRRATAWSAIWRSTAT